MVEIQPHPDQLSRQLWLVVCQCQELLLLVKNSHLLHICTYYGQQLPAMNSHALHALRSCIACHCLLYILLLDICEKPPLIIHACLPGA